MCLVYWSTVVNLCKTFSRTVYECYSNSNLNNIYLLSSLNVCWWVTHVTKCDVCTLLHLHCFTHFYGKQTDSCTVQLWTLSNEGSSYRSMYYIGYDDSLTINTILNVVLIKLALRPKCYLSVIKLSFKMCTYV